MCNNKSLYRTLGFMLSIIILISFAFGKINLVNSIIAKSETDKKYLLQSEDYCEAIDKEILLNSNHYKRLRDKEENLNEVVYQNTDGSETLYLFGEAVKYVDSQRKIVDKSNRLFEIKDEKYSYSNVKNDINVYFPCNFDNNGILLKWNNGSINMIPENYKRGIEAQIIEENGCDSVVYEKAFGEGTSVRYSSLFSGVKECITIDNAEVNTFSFIVKCEEHEVIKKGNMVVFKNISNGEIDAVIDPLFIFDSADNDNLHFSENSRYEVEKVNDCEYRIIIIVDLEYLYDSNLVYPVYIDPSVTITSSGTGSSKTILDTPIYNGSGVASMTAGSNSSATIGKVGVIGGVDYGVGRLLMKFPGLMTKSFMSSDSYYISSAFLHMTDGSGNTTSSAIGAYIYKGSSWNESTIYSNSIWNGIYLINGTTEYSIDSCALSYPNQTSASFDIAEAVRLWQSNHQYANNGLMLKLINGTYESNTAYHRALFTTESSNKPYLAVSYISRGINNSSYLSFGMSSKTFPLKLVGTTTQSSMWSFMISQACTFWNTSTASTNISTVTSGNTICTIEVKATGDPLVYGVTSSIANSSNEITSANITINTTALDGETSNVKMSTIVHELGHVLWLKDNPSTSDFSLMKHNRIRDLIFIPQMYDAFHVREKYS